MNGTTDKAQADRKKEARGEAGALPPSPGTVLRAQLRLLLLKKWKLLGALTTAIALITLLGLTDDIAPTVSGLLLESPLYVVGWILAVGWAQSIWSDEGPGDRAYHWSLPLERPVHDLTRVGLGTLIYVVVGVSSLAAAWLVYAVFGASVAFGEPAAWGLMLLGIIIGCLLGTIPALLTEHPVRWTVGTVLGYAILGGLLEAGGQRWNWLAVPASAVQSVWDGEYGLEAALFAPHQVAGYAEELITSPVSAGLLWLGVAAAVVVGVSFLHLERAKGAAG